jgi:hypothetical protein
VRRGKIKGMSEFLIGVADLLKGEGLTFEYMYSDDPEHVLVNFCTDRHEYSIGWEPYWEGGTLGLVVWHGSAERDLVSGPLEVATWKSIKTAIAREDAECVHEFISYWHEGTDPA